MRHHLLGHVKPDGVIDIKKIDGISRAKLLFRPTNNAFFFQTIHQTLPF